jgi:hypothetical protein
MGTLYEFDRSNHAPASNHALFTQFEMNDQHGFLPENDPLETLQQPEFAVREHAARTQPKSAPVEHHLCRI